jgi:hypothetical protein
LSREPTTLHELLEVESPNCTKFPVPAAKTMAVLCPSCSARNAAAGRAGRNLFAKSRAGGKAFGCLLLRQPLHHLRRCRLRKVRSVMAERLAPHLPTARHKGARRFAREQCPGQRSRIDAFGNSKTSLLARMLPWRCMNAIGFRLRQRVTMSSINASCQTDQTDHGDCHQTNQHPRPWPAAAI